MQRLLAAFFVLAATLTAQTQGNPPQSGSPSGRYWINTKGTLRLDPPMGTLWPTYGYPAIDQQHTSVKNKTPMDYAIADDIVFSIPYGAENIELPCSYGLEESNYYIPGYGAIPSIYFWQSFINCITMEFPIGGSVNWPAQQTDFHAVLEENVSVGKYTFTGTLTGDSYWTPGPRYHWQASSCQPGAMAYTQLNGLTGCAPYNQPTLASFESFCGSHRSATTVNAFVDQSGNIGLNPSTISTPGIIDCAILNNTNQPGGSGGSGNGGYPGPEGGPLTNGCNAADADCDCTDAITFLPVSCSMDTEVKKTLPNGQTVTLAGPVLEVAPPPVVTVDNAYAGAWGLANFSGYSVSGMAYSSVGVSQVEILRDAVPGDANYVAGEFNLDDVGPATIVGCAPGPIAAEQLNYRSDLKYQLPAGAQCPQFWFMSNVANAAALSAPGGTFQGNLYAEPHDTIPNSPPGKIVQIPLFNSNRTGQTSQIVAGLVTQEMTQSDNGTVTLAIPFNDGTTGAPNAANSALFIAGVIGPSLNAAGACYFQANLATPHQSFEPAGTLYLYNDAGTGVLPTTLPLGTTQSTNFPSNSHCSIVGAVVTTIGNDTVLDLTLNQTSADTYNTFIWTWMQNTSGATTGGWQLTGALSPPNYPTTSAVKFDTSQIQTAINAEAVPGSYPYVGRPLYFSVDAVDGNGAQNVTAFDGLIGTTLSLANSCAFGLTLTQPLNGPGSGTIWLWNDAGTNTTGTPWPGTGTVSNSQCTINAQGSSNFNAAIFPAIGGYNVTTTFDVTLAQKYYNAGPQTSLYMWTGITDTSGFQGWTPYAAIVIP